MVLIQLLSMRYIATKLSAFGRLIPINFNICSVHVSGPQNRNHRTMINDTEQTILNWPQSQSVRPFNISVV